jgi:ferredoxin-NADP reductase
LNIYVKDYGSPDTLSNHLHTNINSYQENDLIIRGPVGMGLNLDDILQGTYVAIAGGTGIIPFLDLVALTLRYTVSKLNSVNTNEDFSDIKSDYQLMLFASFSNKDSVIYDDICSRLQQINDKNGLRLFKYVIRISSKNHSKWNDAFWLNNLTEDRGKINKVFLSGPVNFMEDVKHGILSSRVVQENKIVYV